MTRRLAKRVVVDDIVQSVVHSYLIFFRHIILEREPEDAIIAKNIGDNLS